MESKVIDFEVFDVRFPTSLNADGSDPVHTNPDYSVAYVILKTDKLHHGHGFTFTCGKGTDIVVMAIKELGKLIVGLTMKEITDDFAATYRKLTSHPQLRWIGPEKGVIQLATAALLNAIWDLWAKIEQKPLWKFLAEMEPEKLVSTIDFRYLSDALTKQEAIGILKSMRNGVQERSTYLEKNGFPAYTTGAGWIGYSDEKLRGLCRKYKEDGFTRFKMKVGANLQDDFRRLTIIRDEIGPESLLMTDSNQCWDVEEAIEWMKKLSHFNILWIEEPTSPDDVIGHKKISDGLKPFNIKVATGEQCQNRVIFKQLLQSGAIQFCQIDSCRVGGVNENLAIILMAKKFGVPVCPHAGGIGLCEVVQHLAMFDYVAVSGSMDNRMIEYVPHLHDHMKYPVVIKGDRYMPPKDPGYSSDMVERSVEEYSYPNGTEWIELKKQYPQFRE